MCTHQHRRSCWLGFQIVRQPCKLLRIDPPFVGAIRSKSNRVQHNKVHALVVKAVVRLTYVLFVVLLSIERICRSHAALRVDAKTIVIADRVIDLQTQVLLRLLIEIEETQRPLLGNTQRVEDMVSTLDSEVGRYGAHLLERHIAALCCIELRLDMRVRQEDEVEVLQSRRFAIRSGSTLSESW